MDHWVREALRRQPASDGEGVKADLLRMSDPRL
jgi:hypothetical protein